MPEDKRWDTTGYRVLPQADRGGDGFAIHVHKDDAALDAAASGKPFETVRVPAGAVATRMPAQYVKGLLAKGWIVKADGPDDPYKSAGKPKASAGPAAPPPLPPPEPEPEPDDDDDEYDDEEGEP